MLARAPPCVDGGHFDARHSELRDWSKLRRNDARLHQSQNAVKSVEARDDRNIWNGEGLVVTHLRTSLSGRNYRVHMNVDSPL